MSPVAPISTPPATPATQAPWPDRWQNPQLTTARPVLAAGPGGSLGFGTQLVLGNAVALRPGGIDDAFAAAASPGSPIAVVSGPGNSGPGSQASFTIGRAELGYVGATGNPDIDWYKPSVGGFDLADPARAYRELQRLHFAENVHGIVSGPSAYLPIIQHGEVGEPVPTPPDAEMGMRYLGSGLYARSGFASASLDQALASAKLLSQEAGHAFAVLAAPGADGTPASFEVSPLTESVVQPHPPTRVPQPDVDYALEDYALTPGTFLGGPLDSSVLAILHDGALAAPARRHAAVGPVAA